VAVISILTSARWFAKAVAVGVQVFAARENRSLLTDQKLVYETRFRAGYRRTVEKIALASRAS